MRLDDDHVESTGGKSADQKTEDPVMESISYCLKADGFRPFICGMSFWVFRCDKDGNWNQADHRSFSSDRV